MFPRRPIKCLLASALLAATAAPALFAAGPRHLAADRPFDISHIKLETRVDLQGKTVASRATVEGSALRDVAALRFDAVDFDVSRVQVGLSESTPVDCDFDYDGEAITVNLPEKLAAGARARIIVEYTLSDPKAGLNFFAPSEDDPDAPYVVWSQGQSITNRYWVPCFDHPNEMQTSEIICTVAKPNIVISNGRLAKVTENDDNTRTYHWRQEQPHVAYLMTLVAGEFVSKTETWRGKPITYHVRKKFEHMMDNSFSNTLPMLDFFSDKIGVEYPWTRYNQICCYRFGGGMENTSSTTLGERTLHDDRAHLDTSSDGLVAHELAHQWWGDLLTCREWAHLWLNEGFASYFQALWTEESLGQDEFARDLLGKARRALRGGKDKPIVHRDYDRPREQFDARAYPKGAWVLHMIRRRLGDDLFWKVINTYCTRHRHQTVETVDLRKAVEDVTGRSFERFFHDWTARPGHPEVKVSYKWIAEDGLARVEVVQTQEADAFHFPLKLAFHFDGEAEPFVFTGKIDEKKASFYLPMKAKPKLFSVDPDQAVLMDLTEKKPRSLWAAQLERDPNAASRIAAADHFAESATPADGELLARRLAEEGFWAVQAAIAEGLGKVADDPARDALLAGLKIEHPKARAAVVDALGEFSKDAEIETALARLIEAGDPSYRVEANAIEAYAATCTENPLLVLEAALAKDSHRDMVRAAALRALGEHCDDQRFDLLVDWSRPGRSNECRRAAIAAMGEAIKAGDLSSETVKRSIETLRDHLGSKARWIQASALRAAGEIGQDARPLLREVERLADAPENRFRVRRSAKAALKKIRGDSDADEQIEDLRKDLAELEEENSSLSERVKKLEAAGESKHPAETGSGVSGK